MTYFKEARDLVARWEHGDEQHRQWLRDMAVPDVEAFARRMHAEGFVEGLTKAVENLDDINPGEWPSALTREIAEDIIATVKAAILAALTERTDMTENWKPGQKIETLSAWIVEEPDGGEGIISIKLGDHQMPLVGADKERMESLRPFAERARKQSGYPTRLVHFTNRVVLEDLA